MSGKSKYSQQKLIIQEIKDQRSRTSAVINDRRENGEEEEGRAGEERRGGQKKRNQGSKPISKSDKFNRKNGWRRLLPVPQITETEAKLFIWPNNSNDSFEWNSASNLIIQHFLSRPRLLIASFPLLSPPLFRLRLTFNISRFFSAHLFVLFLVFHFLFFFFCHLYSIFSRVLRIRKKTLTSSVQSNRIFPSC